LIVLMTQRVVRLLAGVSAVACAAVAAVSLWPSAGNTRVEDRNGDGRPDVWRVYDQQRQLSEVSIDTNFDGRSDVEEYYDRGALVRRESDRDFSDRVDFVEEFDATTHEHVRSVADVDFDGKADLLELFQAGRLVYVKWASQVAPASAADVPPSTSACRHGRRMIDWRPSRIRSWATLPLAPCTFRSVRADGSAWQHRVGCLHPSRTASVPWSSRWSSIAPPSRFQFPPRSVRLRHAAGAPG
jgi:hypothetical protein